MKHLKLGLLAVITSLVAVVIFLDKKNNKAGLYNEEDLNDTVSDESSNSIVIDEVVDESLVE